MSVYGDPQPYPNAKLERAMLAGRIKAACQFRDLHAPGSTRYLSWQATIDQLLEHYANADVRAVTSLLDEETPA